MTLLGVRPYGHDQLAITNVVAGSESGRQVAWQLRKGGSLGWRAVDVIVASRSFVISAREEYSAVLTSNQGDVDALIAFLRR